MSIPFSIAGSKVIVAGSLFVLAACSGTSSDDLALEEGLTERSTDAEDSGAAQAPPRGGDGRDVSALEQPIFGSNSCQNADIRILNELDFPITVRSIDYYNGSERRWQHEDLSNQLVVPGAMEFWTPSFSNTDNDLIYSFDVNFDHDEDADGDPIAIHAHRHHVNVPDQRCNTGAVYLLEIQ